MLPVRYDELTTVDISVVVELLARVLVGTKGVLEIDDSAVIVVDKVVGLSDTTIVGERVFNKLDPEDVISDEIGDIVVNMFVD